MLPILKNIYYSFPFQLFIIHLKKQHILLFFWVMLFGLVTKIIFAKLGMPYLFLDPEYLGHVNFISFFLLGITFGGFLMSWNVASYILHSFRFPFLATLRWPFQKFCLNNSLLPLIFILIFSISVCYFQLHSEYSSAINIIIYLVGFYCGTIVFLFIAFTYFFNTNTDIFKVPGIDMKKLESQATDIIERKRKEVNKFEKSKSGWRINVYLSSPFKIRLVRSVAHYDTAILKSVFRQNHINALLIEVFAFAILIALGLLIDYPSFRIPAGASILLLFSILIMITGALSFWLNGWRSIVLMVILLLLNYFIGFNFLNPKNKAFGINYDREKAVYDVEQLKKISTGEKIETDKQRTISILNNWKNKFGQTDKNNPKPKIIFINASGGGLRSAVWTMKILQDVDSMMQGKLMGKVFMITGASGGMLGASYYRELFLRKMTHDSINLHSKEYLDNISKDLLNAPSYSLAVTDIFFPWQKTRINGHNYPKDRGYAFERQLNENTFYLLDKKLSDYTGLEAEAKIPMMVFSPTIINDGRRLYISAQPVAYLTRPVESYSLVDEQDVDAVDFSAFFSKQEPHNLQFSSVLRMNSTVPYIMPSVILPSDPYIEVMDAGMRDNFGVESTIRFLHVFKNWINENTSGVVLIQIRDTKKENEPEQKNKETIFDKLLNPVGNFYSNWSKFQDFYHDNLVGYAVPWVNGKMEVIRFEYIPVNKNKNASLSWHLTTSEKQDIINAVYLPQNQESLRKLKKMAE